MTNKNEDLDRILAEIDAQEDDLEDLKKRLVNRAGTRGQQTQLNRNPQTASASNYNRVTVHRPTIPSSIGEDYQTRYDCFLSLINSVNYGTGNAREYVEGHQQALEKAVESACINPNYLYMVEGMVNDELNKLRISGTTGLKSKGYSDGLHYVLSALKKSKMMMASRINRILKEELK